MSCDGLFNGTSWHDYSESRRLRCAQEIRSYDLAFVLSTPEEELVESFYSKYSLEPVVLHSGERYLESEPTESAGGMGYRYLHFSVRIPFEGSEGLFSVTPTSYQYNHGTGEDVNMGVKGGEVFMNVTMPIGGGQVDPNAIADRHVSTLESNAKRMANDVGIFNSSLFSSIQEQVRRRVKEAGETRSVIDSLNLPIKKRENVPTTYSIPAVQKRASITERPKTKTYTAEPTLELGEYENILSILKDMALAMERSPRTFSRLKEEEIRDFFVILLNGHYQGSATGETFNGAGKTDILLRYKGENAFIGECKIWKGQKQMEEAIDQLLGYVTWRDTKTALLVFSKKRDLTAVLSKADAAIRMHSNFKLASNFTSSSLEGSDATYAYKFTHPSDPEKDVFVSLLAFQIAEPDDGE